MRRIRNRAILALILAALVSLGACDSDNEVPDTMIVEGPSDNWSSSSATFVWTATDDQDGLGELLFTYQLGASEWSPLTSETSATVGGIVKGRNRFRVMAIDSDGRADPTPAEWIFTADPVDNTPPDTTILSGPVGTVGTDAVEFTWSGSDAEDPEGALTFRWRLDGSAWSEPQAATFIGLTGLSEGSHTFEVAARDTMGLDDPTPAVAQFDVDLSVDSDVTPPETEITSSSVSQAPNGWLGSWSWIGYDDQDASDQLTYSYRLDDQAWSGFETWVSVQMTIAASGDHVFQVRAMDTSGNVDPTPATHSFSLAAYGVSLTANTLSLTVNAGDSAVFDLVVTNTGTLTDDITIQLSPQVPATWSAFACLSSDGICFFDSRTVTIAAGASEDLQADIVTDPGAASGDSGSLTVTVTSGGDPSISDSVTLQASVN